MEMDDNTFWLRMVQSLMMLVLLMLVSGLVFNTVQMRTLTAANYCEQRDTASWIRCDLLPR